MKTSFKKLVAGASIVALVAMNSAFASSITFNGSVTGGDINTNVEYDTVTKIGTGSSTVNVTATVLPILSMTLSTGALNFGELTPGLTSTQSLNIVTASNAIAGITVSVASTGLATGDTATGRHIGALQRVASTETTGTDSYQIKSDKAVLGRTADTLDNVKSIQNVLEAGNVADSNVTTNVELEVNIDAQTEAGSYTDTLTFTVTGNF